MRCPYCGFHHLEVQERCARCRKPLGAEAGDASDSFDESSASLEESEIIAGPPAAAENAAEREATGEAPLPERRAREAEDAGRSPETAGPQNAVDSPSASSESSVSIPGVGVLKTEPVEEDEESLLAEDTGGASVELAIQKQEPVEDAVEGPAPDEGSDTFDQAADNDAGTDETEPPTGPCPDGGEIKPDPYQPPAEAAFEPAAFSPETPAPDSAAAEPAEAPLPAPDPPIHETGPVESPDESGPGIVLKDDLSEDEDSENTASLLEQLNRLLSDEHSKPAGAAPALEGAGREEAGRGRETVMTEEEIIAALAKEITTPGPPEAAEDSSSLANEPAEADPEPAMNMDARPKPLAPEEPLKSNAAQQPATGDVSEGTSSASREERMVDKFFKEEPGAERQKKADHDDVSNIEIRPQRQDPEDEPAPLKLPLGDSSSGSSSRDRMLRAKGVRSITRVKTRPRIFNKAWLLTLRRAGAGLIDALVWAGLGIVLFKTTLAVTGAGALHGTAWEWAHLIVLPLVIITAVLAMVYGGLFGSVTGRTPGMMAFGLKMSGADGGRPRPGRAFLRTGVYLLSILPLGAGLALILLDGQKGGLHDRISGIKVEKV
jgi:uncharacterized RDD family membrane protein YckC